MVENEKTKFTEYALSSVRNVERFPGFVSYAEHFCELKGLFKKNHSKAKYKEIWFELEIINGLFLFDWSPEVSLIYLQKKWEENYMKDATELVKELLKTMD